MKAERSSVVERTNHIIERRRVKIITSSINDLIEYEYYEVLEDEPEAEDVAMFIESRKGRTLLQYNGHRYRRAYRTKNGTRWTCSAYKNCSAFVYLNDDDEILMTSKHHDHGRQKARPRKTSRTEKTPRETGLIITSRKGKEIILFRSFTYRKQYASAQKVRWVCSTKKNCHAVLFTDTSNQITSALEEHSHDPPKYYLDPQNLLGAIKGSVRIETV